MAGTHGSVEATLNGLNLTIDSRTGSILEMSYPGPGTILREDPDRASLVDVAYPLEQFEALRLASRYSSGAQVTKTADSVTIRIPRLGPSRPNFAVEGDVSATVVLKADADGRSVIATCEIENNSKLSVKQVIFPDFLGLLPVDGIDTTIFKTCGFGRAPFRELIVPEVDQWYAVNNSVAEFDSGGTFNAMWNRWMDLSGLNGGFSLFPKRWGWEPRTKTVLQLSQATKRLRMANLHAVEIKPGERWNSGEFVLTPHKQGWAKGIEVYREWVKAHVKRLYPVPKHVKEGLGFRSLWMCQNQPNDPSDAIWKLNQIPEIAAEAKDHGLDEMVLWAWNRGFDIPFKDPYRHLGTIDDLRNAVAGAKKIGVNVAPFISVIQANKWTAPRYGLTIPDNNGWTYHTEMLPRWNPPYATGFSCVAVGPANQKWQDDVVDSCKGLADLGVPSVSWDQYFAGQEQPDIYTLTKRIRNYAKEKDPESTFSAEELWNMEMDCDYLDYTWNWGTYRDCQAFTNAFPAPRINCNINTSESEVKWAFMDNLYLNVWPSKPDSINGSANIKDYPKLSATLKQCAKLRKQFLPYFTDGILIGNCAQTEWNPGIRTSAYVLPDRMMALVVNPGAEQPLKVKYDLEPWVKSPSHKYEMKSYDADGNLLESKEITSRTRTLTTKSLKPMEIAVYEFVAK